MPGTVQLMQWSPFLTTRHIIKPVSLNAQADSNCILQNTQF
jgi:hypothetical protein